MSVKRCQAQIVYVGSLVLALLLGACGSETAPDGAAENVISGTVTAPAGYDVQGTQLQLCAEQDCLEQQIDQTGTSATFAFENLEEATYRLTAFKQASETSFLVGCYGTNDGPVCLPEAISPPERNADITLTLSELPTPPGPPPAPPLGEPSTP